MQLVTAPKKLVGDMVRLGLADDVIKTRKVPLIAETIYDRGLERYFEWVHEEPDLAHRPSIQQMTAVLELLRVGSRLTSQWLIHTTFGRSVK